MKILVTGSSGFLNHHLREEFKKFPEQQVVYAGRKDCNLTKYNQVIEFFEKQKETFDVILHTAANCGGIGYNQKNPAILLTDNLHMGLNIYEAARIYGVKKVYSLGSVCSYPIHCPIPFKEEDLWIGRPEPTNEGYGFAKKALLMLGLTYRQQFGIGGAHFIPVNMMGTFDHFDLNNSHVIPALINKFITAQKENLPEVYCWGTGVASREFLNAQDCAEAICQAVVTSFDHPEPINLGTGQEISIKDLAEKIAKLTGFAGKIVFTGEVSDGQPRRCLDISKAKDLLGWEAKISLEEGLKETIKWYKMNY